MLRPATPLAILLAGAFVLLLISVISAPIVKSIYLGKANDVVFGVFGYCPAKGDCSSVGIGYDNGMEEPNRRLTRLYLLTRFDIQIKS